MEAQSSLKPSEVRLRVLGEHEHLRSTLALAERAADAVMTGASPEAAGLPARLAELLTELEAHIRTENAILVPAALDLDCWGPLRAQRLLDQHEAQLETLAALGRTARSAPAADTAKRVKTLVADVLEDMRQEESDLLRPECLKDDLVVIGQSAG